MIRSIVLSVLVLSSGMAVAQTSQRSGTIRVQGNTEINAVADNMTAVATGEQTVAKNRVGVVQGNKKGDTNINVVTRSVTTISSGRNKKACTNIGGIVSDECK